jgi:hypothetical protein
VHPRDLCHSAIGKSYHVEPCQGHSIHEVPSRRGRHEALCRTGDLTARRPQRGGQHRFQFSVGNGFGRRIEHERKLQRADVQNKNKQPPISGGASAVDTQNAKAGALTGSHLSLVWTISTV